MGEARLPRVWRVGLVAWVLPGPHLWPCRRRLCQGRWGAKDTYSELPHPCRSRDFYHTCYCLSGLSIAQHFGSGAMLHNVVLGVPENALVRRDAGGSLPPVLHRALRTGLAGGQSSPVGPPEPTTRESPMDGLVSLPSPHPLRLQPIPHLWAPDRANSRF